MPKYSLTNKGNVVQCKWNCKANHEHYVGSYENAIKYFGIDENEIKSYGKLINIIIYHQTSRQTIPKLSNELYDILINAMSKHKYWVPQEKRHEVAMETLLQAKKAGLIIDDKICKTIEEKAKDNFIAQRRIYLFKLWYEYNDY